MEIMKDTSYYKIFLSFLKQIKAYTTYLIKKFFKPNHINLDGVVLTINSIVTDDVRDAMYRNRYESTEIICLQNILESNDIVMELGSGLGFVSTFCAKRLGSSKIFTYEANPILIPQIEQTYKANGVQPSLKQAVLDIKDGERDFYIHSDLRSSSLFTRTGGQKTIQVEAIDVNKEISQIKPTLLIIDIEGGEIALVPSINFSTTGICIQKIIIELHERITGQTAKDALRHYFTIHNFSVNPKFSQNEVFYLERIQ